MTEPTVILRAQSARQDPAGDKVAWILTLAALAQDDMVLLEQASAALAEHDPQDNEDQDGAEAPATQFLGTVTSGDATQQLAHSFSRGRFWSGSHAGCGPDAQLS
jgi:hypothetical protein